MNHKIFALYLQPAQYKAQFCTEVKTKWADESECFCKCRRSKQPLWLKKKKKLFLGFFIIVFLRHFTVNWVKWSRHTQRGWHYPECQEWQIWFKMSSPAFITPNAFFMNPPGSRSLSLSFAFCAHLTPAKLYVLHCLLLLFFTDSDVIWAGWGTEPLHQPPLSSPSLGESVPFIYRR